MDIVRLGDIVSFQTGKLNSNAAKSDGAYPFFTCSQETFRTDTYSFDTECILLGGNNASGIYPLKYFSGKFDAYQRTYVIESTNKSKSSNRFLFYALRLKLEILKSISTGAATKFLTLTILRDLQIELPSIGSQQKIASILSAYDDLIENNNRRIKILEEMAQLIYKEWFVDFRFPGHEKVKMVKSELGMIPEGWEVKTLGEVIELAYGKALKAEDRLPGHVPVYGSAGVVGFHNESLVKGPGIIVGRKGNVGSVFWSEKDFYPIDTVFYVKTLIQLHYVYLSLLEQNFINTDAAVPGLNRNQAYKNNFVLPTKDVREKFVFIVESIFKKTELLRNKNENLRKTRDLLLPKLISGEIDVENLEVKI